MPILEVRRQNNDQPLRYTAVAGQSHISKQPRLPWRHRTRLYFRHLNMEEQSRLASPKRNGVGYDCRLRVPLKKRESRLGSW